MENFINESTILILLTGLILFLGLICFHKRVTIPSGSIILSTKLIIDLVFISAKGLSLLWLIYPAILLIGFVAFKYYFNSLNFTKRILTFVPNKNKLKNGRIIGKCFPYYKKQLKYNNSTIVQSETALKGGTIITGSSGSGKTFLIKELIKQDISNGKRVTFVNFKGDRDTTDDIEKELPSDIPLYKLTYEECNFSYDPLKNLDESGKVEAILNMRAWSMDGSDAHYKTGVQLFLQKSVKDFQYQQGNYLKEYYKYLSKLNVPREEYDSYNTVMKLLELTLTSDVGQNLFSEENETFDFNQNGQYCVLVNFTSAQKTLGTAITSLMFRDLLEVGTKEGYSPELSLYVDEFGTCESPLIVKDILEKGRSCCICPVISMQDLNQLIITTSAPFLDSVLGTINSCIVFAGATRNTAEKLAGTQIYEIDDLLMSLQKPVDGRSPTAMFISKYPVFEKGGTEVYRFVPYTSKKIISTDKKNNFKPINKVKTPVVQQETQNSNIQNFENQVQEEQQTTSVKIEDLSSFL